MHDLILTIVDRGFADDVMDAAKSAGARGGTILHARGTGAQEAEKFFGIVVQPEKELVMILVEHAIKNDVMTAICQKNEITDAGRGICFSLPVEAAAGLHRHAESEETV